MRKKLLSWLHHAFDHGMLCTLVRYTHSTSGNSNLTTFNNGLTAQSTCVVLEHDVLTFAAAFERRLPKGARCCTVFVGHHGSRNRCTGVLSTGELSQRKST